jgi:hypothetical protein
LPTSRPVTARLILDLCAGTGAWSEPYRLAGYEVVRVTLPLQDVRTFQPPEREVWGVLAAPPCTHFSVSGARWWKEKDRRGLTWEGLGVVQACLRLIERVQPTWWALENPVGRLRRYLGPPRYSFQPYEYGDPWLKRTCIWGTAARPRGTPVSPPTGGPGRWRVSLTNHLSPTPTPAQLAKLVKTGMIPADWVHRLGPSPERATLRAITPPGFAKAFFEANP